MVLGLGLLAGSVSEAQTQRPPTFVGRTERVRFEVSVFDDRGNVTGLEPSDFVINDSGIPVQKFTVQELSELPLDLVLVSQPLQSLWGLQPALFDGSVAALLRGLRSPDRLAVLVASVPPSRLRTLTDVSRAFDVGLMAGTHETALWDAIAAGLMEFDVVDKRKVLLVLSEGIDGFSILRPEFIGAAASPLKIQLVFLGSTPRLLQGIRYRWPNGRLEGTPQYANRFPPLALRVLADDSGGQVIDLLEKNPADVVSGLLKRLRSGYLISYEGTNAAGWHPVSVTVRKRGARVAARAGYVVDRQ